MGRNKHQRQQRKELFATVSNLPTGPSQHALPPKPPPGPLAKRPRDDTTDDMNIQRPARRARGVGPQLHGRCFHCYVADHKWFHCSRTCIHCSTNEHCETAPGRGDARRCPVLSANDPGIYGAFERVAPVPVPPPPPAPAPVSVVPTTPRVSGGGTPAAQYWQSILQQRTPSEPQRQDLSVTRQSASHDSGTIEELRRENASLQSTIEDLRAELEEERGFRNVAMKQVYKDGWREGEQHLLQHQAMSSSGGSEHMPTPISEPRAPLPRAGPQPRVPAGRDFEAERQAYMDSQADAYFGSYDGGRSAQSGTPDFRFGGHGGASSYGPPPGGYGTAAPVEYQGSGFQVRGHGSGGQSGAPGVGYGGSPYTWHGGQTGARGGYGGR